MRFWISLIALSLYFTSPVSGRDFNPKKIYQETSKAVVLIAAFELGDNDASTGSGSIIQSDGLVLTNAHVVFNQQRNSPYSEIRIFLKPDRVTGNMKNDTSRKVKARLVQYSNELDLALLKIQKNHAINRLPFLELSNLRKIAIGDPVLAIGHPEQGGFWTLTTGTISSLIENFGDAPGKHVFQTETSINRGNSGGPLIDTYGDIVGVNSMIARKGENNVAITDINFSIKSTVAVKWMNSVGYPFQYATPKVTYKDGTDSIVDNAGIVPVPKQEKIPIEKVPEPPAQATPGKLIGQQPVPKQDSLNLNGKTEPIVQVQPEILTELHPYKKQDLFQRVEDELEDMMEEMKGKLRNR
jgi:serine protease Do